MPIHAFISGLLASSKALLIVLLILNLHTVSANEQEDAFSFAVVPQLPALTLHSNWTPFLDRLTALTGYKFNLVIHPGIPEFESDLYQGGPDFAYMNPYQQTMVKNTVGYVPIVRDQSKDLSGILVARADSNIRSIHDLNGKTLAFPAPNAFAASLYMRALLTEQEKLKFNVVYVNTHANVYRTVIYKQADAGGGVNKTLLAEPESVKIQLKILYKTPGTKPHPISVHQRVDKKISSAVQSAILSMSENENDRKLLQDIHIPEPVEADYQRDYIEIEKLKLDKYLQ